MQHDPLLMLFLPFGLYYMRDRAFLNLLAVRITEIFLLMLFVNNIICVTVHFLSSPRTYHSNISLNDVCELAFLCLTGNYIINKLDNKTCNPVNMKKKGLRGPVVLLGKGHEHIAILQCQVALSLWMRFFSRGSAGDVNSVIVKAGDVPHHHCAYFIATSVTHLCYF